MKLFSVEIMTVVIAVGVFLTVALVLAVDVLWPQPRRRAAPSREPARETYDVLSRR